MSRRETVILDGIVVNFGPTGYSAPGVAFSASGLNNPGPAIVLPRLARAYGKEELARTMEKVESAWRSWLHVGKERW